MEAQLVKCLSHNALNEIFCDSCNKFVCPQCLSSHSAHNQEGSFTHVFKYSQDKIMPVFDSLMETVDEREKNVERESLEVIMTLQEVIPRLVEAVMQQKKKLMELKVVTERLKEYCNTTEGEQITGDSVISGVVADKERLERAIKEKNIQETLKFSVKAKMEEPLTKLKTPIKTIMQNLENAMEKLNHQREFEKIFAAMSGMLAKCNSLQLLPYINNWRCDKAYLSGKMYLSEDGLTFGNTATNGYPAIIGNLPFDSGLYAFEVVPHGLECSKKEGFGIVEIEKYLAAVRRDPVTPAVSDEMIGFLFSKEYKGMKAIRAGEMQMDAKYYVKVNIPELTMTIFGPNLLLRAELKPNVVYYPCFSCGCSSNRITIRPLETYDEVEEPAFITNCLTIRMIALMLLCSGVLGFWGSLSLIHICRCRRYAVCRSRWSPYH
eukprot:TRINITY_DN11427_c0_g1_i3.p1 TRINITY_DN11427_c0_g1~~TRINITY_DN11427_c0_g1_i3.p1  ORF type:complete len:435 (-),score=114.17 TRINITY_DN11427_c0_g1_i3:34-1338(-)